MPTFKVPQTDGDIELAVYNSGLVKARTWTVTDSQVVVADEDAEIFAINVTGAVEVTVGQTPPEEAPPATESSNAE